METDVKASTISATGTVVATARTRVRYISYVSTVTAGTIVFKDGGSGGTTILSLATAPLVGTFTIELPGNGLLFQTDVHATLSASVTSLTTIYG